VAEADRAPEGEEELDEVEQHRMPLIEHLIELRRRLLYALIALVIAFVGCYLVAEQIYQFLVHPLAGVLGENGRLIYTALHEVFFTYIKIAFFAAVCITFPILAGQLWAFVAPGLYRNERRAFLPFLIASPILFAIGVALVYYVIFPIAWQFFGSFQTLGGGGELAIQLEPKVNEYLSLVMTLMFAFGLCFQLPVLLILMARTGLVSAAGLVQKRKYAIVITFAVAAILTPPDPFTQIMLAIPILVLYEISIFGARMIEKKRAQARAEAEASI
jgi:sec-independent protein translocase protein TatC